MAKHMRTCVYCGRQFNTYDGGFYNREKRDYYCKSCGKKYKRELRMQITGMKQSYLAMIVKILIGILFLLIKLFQVLLK